MPTEIIIEVKDGCVVGVYCNDPNATVQILDHDSGDLDETIEERINDLHEVG